MAVLQASMAKFETPTTVLSDNGSCFAGVGRQYQRGFVHRRQLRQRIVLRGREKGGARKVMDACGIWIGTAWPRHRADQRPPQPPSDERQAREAPPHPGGGSAPLGGCRGLSRLQRGAAAPVPRHGQRRGPDAGTSQQKGPRRGQGKFPKWMKDANDEEK